MMSKILEFIKLYRLPILSGVLIGTSYAPFPAWALLFCYVPLWLFITEESRTLKEIFWGAWLTQFILSLIGFYWVTNVLHEFAHLPWPVAIFVLLIFCSLVHLYIPVAHLFSLSVKKKFRLSLGFTALILPLSLSLSEQYWPSIFPWHLGYSLISSHLPIYQFADIIGFLGLSLFVLLMNAWAFFWWKSTHRSKTQIAAWLGLFITLNIAGHFWGQAWVAPDSHIKAMIVQANIGNSEKVQAEHGHGYQDEIIGKFISLSKQGLQKHNSVDVLVWPETAVPHYMDEKFLSAYYPQKIIQALKDMNVSLITGAYSQEKIDSQSLVYNSMAFLNNQGQLSTPLYRKTHLLAYGEYLPFSETFPILRTWIPQVGNFGRGQGPASFDLSIKNQDIKWGPQICYEGLFPGFSRVLALSGADIFVNVTNDSWYGRSSETSQHMYMTFARAIENRRPLIRSTNTGVSSVILASGEILEKSPLFEEWVGAYDVPFLKNPPLTFYSKWGHLEGIAVVIILAMIIFLGRVLGTRNARSGRP